MFNFVVTPRNFIIANNISAIIKLRGVTTKLNRIFFHHANFQGINYDICFSFRELTIYEKIWDYFLILLGIVT